MSNDKLTINERKFALRFVENGGQLKDAYTHACSTAKLSDAQIMRSAIKMFGKPSVKNYIRELRTELSASAMFDVQQMVNDLVMIVTASPAEIIGWRVGCCRHCYGENNQHQWISEDELAEAQAVAIDSMAKRLPMEQGGFGFDHTRPPSRTCPHCRGEGVGRVHLADTRTLSPAAQRLYQGVKIGSNGQIEVKMRSQDEALKSLMRIYGVYNPAAMLAPPKLAKDTQTNTSPVAIDVPRDAQQASDYYQQFLAGQIQGTKH